MTESTRGPQTGATTLLLPVLIGVLVVAVAVLGAFNAISSPERSLVDPSLEGKAAVDALAALTPEQLANLVEREKRRLTAEPLDVTALNNLAILEDLSKNPGKSEAYVVESASRTFRDTQAQLTALRAYATDKNFERAMYHLDGVLVSDPDLRERLFPSVAGLLQSPDALEAFVKRLNRSPPWRKDFLYWLNNNDANDLLTFRLFGQLRKQGGSVTDSELLEYLRRLIGKHQYDKAYFVWLDSLNQNALLKVGNIFDGEFDLEPKNQFFDWSISRFNNAELGIVKGTDKARGRVLRLSFFGSVEKFDHVSQYLRLKPGTYSFEGHHAAANLRAPDGLKITLSCAVSGEILGESEAFRESTPWRSFTFGVNVPADGCQTQYMRLRSASAAILDAKLDGEMQFDGFRIEPAELKPVDQGN